MTAEVDTLRGYETAHGRPPSFEGSDGRPYSVGVFSEDDPGVDGRYGAALIFVRWSAANEPDGHLETEWLAYDADPVLAELAVGALTLKEVKGHLDGLIADRRRVEGE